MSLHEIHERQKLLLRIVHLEDRCSSAQPHAPRAKRRHRQAKVSRGLMIAVGRQKTGILRQNPRISKFCSHQTTYIIAIVSRQLVTPWRHEVRTWIICGAGQVAPAENSL